MCTRIFAYYATIIAFLNAYFMYVQDQPIAPVTE